MAKSSGKISKEPSNGTSAAVDALSKAVAQAKEELQELGAQQKKMSKDIHSLKKSRTEQEEAAADPKTPPEVQELINVRNIARTMYYSVISPFAARGSPGDWPGAWKEAIR
jgi:cell division protein FtsB